MPFGFACFACELGPVPAKVGRPDRGDRAKVKAGRKAAKHGRR